jgi:hypothetical protein
MPLCEPLRRVPTLPTLFFWALGDKTFVLVPTRTKPSGKDPKSKTTKKRRIAGISQSTPPTDLPQSRLLGFPPSFSVVGPIAQTHHIFGFPSPAVCWRK